MTRLLIGVFCAFLLAPLSLQAATVNISTNQTALTPLDLGTFDASADSSLTITGQVSVASNESAFKFGLLPGQEAKNITLNVAGIGAYSFDLFQVGGGSLGSFLTSVNGSTVNLTFADALGAANVSPSILAVFNFVAGPRNGLARFSLGMNLANTYPQPSTPSAVALPASGWLLLGLLLFSGITGWRRRRELHPA